MGRPKGSKNKPKGLKAKEDRQIFMPASPAPRQQATQTKKESQSTKRKRAQYERTNIGDIVYMHKSRNTGALVAVLRGPAEIGIGSGAKWIDMCLAHHQFNIYDARIRATAEANKSDDWCAACAQMVAKKRSKASA